MPRRPAGYARVLKLDKSADRMRELASGLEAEGMPLVDDFRMTPGVATEESDCSLSRPHRRAAGAGITFLALHPNMSGDIETIVPPRAHYRTDEHRLLADRSIGRWIRQGEIQLLGMRAMRDLYRGARRP